MGQTIEDPADLAYYGLVLTGADETDQLRRFRQRHRPEAKITGLSEQLEEARRLAILGAGLRFLLEAYAARDVADGKLHLLLSATADVPPSNIFLILNPNAPAHRSRDLLVGSIRHALAGH